MCGISGLYYFSKTAKADKNTALSMSSMLRHRGPDEETNHTSNNISLSSNRLAIIDPANGRQPCFNESKNIISVFNGEIYNFSEIRSWLMSKGHVFHSNSDSEIIPHLYEEHGEEFVTKLRGMFAIALFDENTNRLILARDRIGIKPLYYTASSEYVVFASEIKALEKFPGFNRDINYSSIIDYFSAGYILNPKTIYSSVNSVRPGHILIAGDGKLIEKQYWELSPSESPLLKDDMIESELLRILDGSVASHMQSDVPLGAFLSGGLDSSMVVSLMHNKSDEPVNTFTANLWYLNRSETDAAIQMSRLCKTNQHELKIDKSVIPEIISIVAHMDEPFADSSIVPAYLISREAAKKVKVALSGDGGDENFAGYPSYKADKIRSYLAMIPLITPMSGAAGEIISHVNADRRINNFFSGIQMETARAHCHWRTVFPAHELDILLNTDLKNISKGYSAEQSFIQHYQQLDRKNDVEDTLNNLMALDIKTWLVDDILKKVDMASMANSLEVRVPFLDSEFVEFAASIPSRLKLHRFKSKYILKKAAKRFIPVNIINMKKSGFNMPLKRLIKEDLKRLIADVVLDESSKKDLLIDFKFTEKLLSEHLKGHKDNSQKIWTIFCYHVWRAH